MPMHAVERWRTGQDVAVVSEKRNGPTRANVQYRECALEIGWVQRKDSDADQVALAISYAPGEWDRPSGQTHGPR